MVSEYATKSGIKREYALSLMKQRKLKWCVLAASLGVDEGNLARILSGKQEPGVSKALKLAELLGTTVEDLFRKGEIPANSQVKFFD